MYSTKDKIKILYIFIELFTILYELTFHWFFECWMLLAEALRVDGARLAVASAGDGIFFR